MASVASAFINGLKKFAPKPTGDQLSAQGWINNPDSGMGGMEAYTKSQNKIFAGADQATRDRLMMDAQRVGYTLHASGAPSMTGGGVTGQGAQMGTGTGTGTGAGVNTGSKAIVSGDNASKAQQYTDKLGTMEPFKYDPNTDPSYQALSQANTANAKVANRDMEEEMNSRGILNSTVTTDRATQIYKQGADATTLAIPQLQQNAFNQYQQNYNNTLGLANQYTNLSNNAFDKNMKTADMTGRYMQPEVKSLIDTVLQAKQDWDKPGADHEAISKMANEARGQLSQYGIDPAMFGSDVTLDQARGNVFKAYTPTMQSQIGNANLITGLAGQYQSIPEGTGDALKNAAPSMGAAADMYKLLENMKTSKTISEEKRNWIDEMQLELSKSSNGVSAGNLKLSQDKFDKENEKGVQAKERQMATDAEVTKVLAKPTKEEAFAYVKANQKQMSDDGVDVIELFNQINKTTHWDVDKAGSTPSLSTPITRP